MKKRRYDEEFNEELDEELDEEAEDDFEDEEPDYEDEELDEDERAYLRHTRRVRNQAVCITVMIVLVLALLSGIGYGSYRLYGYICEQNEAKKLQEEIQNKVNESKEQGEEPATIETPEE